MERKYFCNTIHIFVISYTTKVSQHIPQGFSLSTISSNNSIGNKHDVYRGNNCIKIFCEFFRGHIMEIIN